MTARLDGHRIAHARGCLACVPAGEQKSYRQAIERAPAAIRLCGFGPGLAMLRARAEAPFEHLSRWLLADWPHRPGGGGALSADLKARLATLIDGPQPVYLARRREALAYVDWLKRLSDPWDPQESSEPEASS